MLFARRCIQCLLLRYPLNGLAVSRKVVLHQNG